MQNAQTFFQVKLVQYVYASILIHFVVWLLSQTFVDRFRTVQFTAQKHISIGITLPSEDVNSKWGVDES